VVPTENDTKDLLLPIECKSVETMAARLAPGRVRQTHQSLHYMVAEAAWSDEILASVAKFHRINDSGS
jgi:SRSO17 transposase